MANTTWDKEKPKILVSGPNLGHPTKVTAANAQELKVARQQARQDIIDRNDVEGKFGQGKCCDSLNRSKTKLPHTSETAAVLGVLVMNLIWWLATILFSFFTARDCF